MLVQRKGQEELVKVLDFGLAKLSPALMLDIQLPTASQPKLTQVGEIFGTPAYMAPEQAVGDTVDIRCDLYALGMTLYEMLTGRHPFDSETPLELLQQQLLTPPPPMAERTPGLVVAANVEALVQRLTAKKPEDRFADPQELLGALDGLLAGQPPVLTDAFRNSGTGSNPNHAPVAAPAAISAEQSGAAVIPQRPSIVAKLQQSGFQLKARVGTLPKNFRLGVMVSAGAMVAVGLLFIVRMSITAPHEPAPVHSKNKVVVTAKPDVPLASQSALDAAIAQGPEALETLSSRFPQDGRVQRALVQSLTDKRKYVEAMRTLGKLGAIDANAGRDPEMVKAIVAALQGNNESIHAAVETMERDLGEAGIDLLYDLTIKQTGARWKARANASIGKPEVRAHASTETLAALDLRTAKTCEAKYALLPRIKTEGDHRALLQLKLLALTKGCGFLGLQDCWPCLRKDALLKDTTAALEARSK